MNIKIINLTVETDNKTVLDKFNLEIKEGEIHALMGPNGVGKSTLSKVIMGDDVYHIVDGDIRTNNDSILDKEVDQRSKLGIFLSFQNPIAIEGVTNSELLRSAINANREEPIGLYDFLKKMEVSINELSMDKSMLHRGINLNFSGGEAKKNEILQMKMLEPKFIILDELDSGLDVDSLKIVTENINNYLIDNPKTSVLIITHYPRILDYIKPNYVHILLNGKIIKTGDITLAEEIEKNGYKFANNKIEVVSGESSNE